MSAAKSAKKAPPGGRPLDELTTVCRTLEREADALVGSALMATALRNIAGLGLSVEAKAPEGRADHLETVTEAAAAVRALATPPRFFADLREELTKARMAITDIAVAEGTIDDAIQELGRVALRAVREAEMILEADDRRVAEAAE